MKPTRMFAVVCDETGIPRTVCGSRADALNHRCWWESVIPVLVTPIKPTRTAPKPAKGRGRKTK